MEQNHSQEKKITYIIPHTHWDREWYVPFQYYRFRLVEMIDGLIDLMNKYPEYKYFNLDGQTIPIEDYLEIKPERREPLAKLIKEGRIDIGPWYLQCSPWLQTGEGIVRNLLYGRKICKDFGVNPLKVGWVPDQFIHPPQFPQIYNQFGIHYHAFSRGFGNQYKDNPKLTCEFNWKGLDGSEVIAFHLQHGYGLCANLENNPENALNTCAIDIGKLAGMRWATPVRLGFAGSDHSRAEKILLDVIKEWNEDEDLLEELGPIKLASWSEFLEKFHSYNPSLETIEGELWGRNYQITLPDVFSSYIYLKQRSFHIHDLFEHYAEPFSVLSSIYGLEYKYGFLRIGWKWLLRNQPHDSSWTSSFDQVEKEMETRFDWAEQIATDTYRRSAQWIVQHIKTLNDKSRIPIVIFNPHPWSRSEIIEAVFENKFKKVQLINEKGHEITCQFIPKERDLDDRERRRVFVGSHGPLGKNFYKVKFLAEDIPPLGYKTYYIQERSNDIDIDLPEEGLLDGNDYYLENDVLRIVVEMDGTFTILHKIIPYDENGEIKIMAMGEELPEGSIWNKDQYIKFGGLHVFEDVSDIGDGWESIQIKDDRPIRTPGKLIKSELIEASDVRGILRVEKTFSVPKEAVDDYNARSDETVEIRTITYITLEKGHNPLIRFKTEFTNLAKDHRIRLLFPTDITTDHVVVNGHFAAFERSLKEINGAGWVRPPQKTFPFHKWLSIYDPKKKKGLALLTRGLPEYEIYKLDNDHACIALTLLRATGRWGIHTGISKPIVSTPLAQLYGKKLEFEYALIPQREPWFKNMDGQKPLYRYAEEYYTPLHWEEAYDTYRYYIKPEQRTLPDMSSILEIKEPNIVYSSLKGSQNWFNEKNTYILRFYNILSESSQATIKFNVPAEGIELVDLKEESITDIESYNLNFDKENNLLKLQCPANKIVSVKFRVPNLLK